MKVGILFTTNSRNYYYLCNLCIIYATSKFVETIIYYVDICSCVQWIGEGQGGSHF